VGDKVVNLYEMRSVTFSGGHKTKPYTT